MKIQGAISVLISQDGTRIEIKDKAANTRFAVIQLTLEQLSMALSRLAETPCEIEVRALDRVGKKHENKTFEFEIAESLASSKHEEKLTEIAQSQLSDGWVCDGYFSSRDTFFKKDVKHYARCTVRRWV